MTELKTLKDLNIFYIDFEPLKIKIKEPLLRVEELKAEAVKWVKAKNNVYMFHERTLVDWIIHFFNLTEEDLKTYKLDDVEVSQEDYEHELEECA